MARCRMKPLSLAHRRLQSKASTNADSSRRASSSTAPDADHDRRRHSTHSMAERGPVAAPANDVKKSISAGPRRGGRRPGRHCHHCAAGGAAREDEEAEEEEEEQHREELGEEQE